MPLHIPLPVIANVYRVTLNWVESTTLQKAANVLHFQRSGGTAVDVFNDLNAHVTTNMWYSTSANAKVSAVDVIKLDGTSARVTFGAGTAVWTGQATAGDFIPNQPYIIKESTGVRGRSNRGRVYLPFLVEGQAVDGSIPSGAVTALNTAWAAFLSAMITATCFPVIASYDRAHSGAGAHATMVTQYSAEAVCGTQRRRQQRLRR